MEPFMTIKEMNNLDGVHMSPLCKFWPVTHFFSKKTPNISEFACTFKDPITSEIVPIDWFIYPIVVLLNLKGYYTTNACSGHIDRPWQDDFTDGYLTFYEKELEIEKLADETYDCNVDRSITPSIGKLGRMIRTDGSTYIEWRCSKSPDDIFKMMCYLFEKVNSLPWKKDIADPKLQNFKIDKDKR